NHETIFLWGVVKNKSGMYAKKITYSLPLTSFLSMVMLQIFLQELSSGWGKCYPLYSPKTSRRVSEISPSVQLFSTASITVGKRFSPEEALSFKPCKMASHF